MNFDEDPDPDPQAPPRRRTTNLSERQRNWLFGFLFTARCTLRTGINDVSNLVCNKTAELLVQHRDLTGFERGPAIRTVRSVWTSFESTGQVSRVTKTAGRKPKPVREEVEYLSKFAQQSTREIAAGLTNVGASTSQSTVRRILRKEFKMYFYMKPQGQPLKPHDIDRRFDFATDMKRRLAHKEINILDILFTDECLIGTGAGSNRKNDGHWLLRGELDLSESLIERKFQGEKCHMWVGLQGRIGIIGPFFIKDIPEVNPQRRNSVTGEKYRILLETMVIPELRRRLGSRFNSCWYMQDGAPPHTTLNNIAYLNQTFSGRLISNKSSIIWPPYSPDLNPLDYWFWSHSRKIISQDVPETADEIALSAQRAASEVSISMVRRAIKDFPIRLLALIHFGGGHFEPKLKEFKRNRKAWSTPCESCHEVYYCQCRSCQVACSRNEDDDSDGSISDYIDWEDDSDVSSLEEPEQEDM